MDYMIFIPLASIVALIFAFIMSRVILKNPEGTEKTVKIASIIRIGANTYLKRQYSGVIIFFIIVFAVLFVFSKIGLLNSFTPFAFISGGFFSGLSGYFGMKIATSANSRTATATKNSLNSGLRIAFSSGAVMGFIVVGLGLLDVSIWFFLLKYVFLASIKDVALQAQQMTTCMVTFSIGASSMALFARVGGGIFTKAADVGADLVGKMEAGIPEDDPRNPAVIADNVGDNVGDVAGMGADLYESYVGSILSACALGVVAGFGFNGILIPTGIAACGIISALIGTFFVRTKEKTEQKNLLVALRRGTYIAAALSVIASFCLVYFVLGKENLGIFYAMLVGLVAGVLIGFFTEYYTSDSYKPTQRLSKTSLTGPATVIIDGFALGMQSTVIPIIIIGISVLASYYFAGGSFEISAKGLFGVAVAAVGMLSTLGITLATDAYGPVADNAGGIAQMAGLGNEVRERTDALDSLGNTTAATGKGFAIGSAMLTALALIAAFVSVVISIDENFKFDLSIMNPIVLIGLFIGCVLPYLFSALTMRSVGRAAQSIVQEVRRQFREIKGIMTGEGQPDYESCINICTKAAQKEMILPSVLAIISPIIVGLFLGVNGIIGMLTGSTISGFLLAIMMANAGGAWDNAKKHIEAGNHGGKGSDAHKAAIIGDTVGDPFKDTSGPSINILIKLLSIVSIVFASFIMKFNIISHIIK